MHVPRNIGTIGQSLQPESNRGGVRLADIDTGLINILALLQGKLGCSLKQCERVHAQNTRLVLLLLSEPERDSKPGP